MSSEASTEWLSNTALEELGEATTMSQVTAEIPGILVGDSSPDAEKDKETSSPYNSNTRSVLDTSGLPSLRLFESATDGLSHALQSASTDMEAVVHARGPSMQDALGHGLLSFPDEVLSLVFMDCKDDFWEAAFRLSAVCRRFRSIVYSAPKMWSYVSTRMARPEIVDICLTRSQNAGLQLGIWEGSSDFYLAVREHFRRWESIYVAFGGKEAKVELEKLLPYHYMALDAFPRLKSVVFGPAPRLPHEMKNLVELWKISAQNLHHFALTIQTPSQYIMPASLRRLDLTVFPKQAARDGSTHHLIMLLQSAPLLEDINLDLQTERFNRYTPPMDRGEQEIKIVSMPLVEKVALSFHPHDGLQPLLLALYFPNVSGLCINICNKDIGSDKDPDNDIDNVRPGFRLLNEIFRGNKKYPKLSTLTLTLLFGYEAIHRPNIVVDNDLIMNYAKTCPALHHFTLHCDILIKHLNLPPLRNLKLIHCHLQDVNWLVDYRKALQKDGAWSSFGMLEIYLCDLENGSWEDVSTGYGSKVELEVRYRTYVEDSDSDVDYYCDESEAE